VLFTNKQKKIFFALVGCYSPTSKRKYFSPLLGVIHQQAKENISISF
jgi:hypothetical protein